MIHFGLVKPRARLSQQVVDELEQLIYQDFSKPGSRLPPEPELAERFGVSRIVIREAMKILEDRGLVSVRAGAGTLTLPPSTDRVKSALWRLFRSQAIPSRVEMEQLLELREVLEEAIAESAAERATPEDLAAMEDALERMARGGEEAAQADLDFHLALVRATHNPFFEMVFEPFLHLLLHQITLTADMAIGIPQHEAIYQHVKAHRVVQARQASRRLLRQTRADVLRVLGDPSDLDRQETKNI